MRQRENNKAKPDILISAYSPVCLCLCLCECVLFLNWKTLKLKPEKIFTRLLNVS